MDVKLTILGCGASSGVPLIGCDCPVCTSPDPRNKRTRPSVLFEVGGKKILVDTSPDLRNQALAAQFKTIDAIFFTHAHADHTHGIDDIRSFNYYRNGVVPAYSNVETFQELEQRFGYIFLPPIPQYGWFRPSLTVHKISYGKQTIADVPVTVFPQDHGRITSLGLRIGDIAYSTDTNALPDEAFAALKGVKIWVVDCLRYDPAPTHAHLEKSLAWIACVQPEQAYLTHLSHQFDYEQLSAELPPNVEPAYDGLVITRTS